MKKLFLITLLLCTAAFAQQPAPKPPASVGDVIDRQFSTVEREFVPLVEAMPAEKFDFAPTTGEFKGVRTFARQALHVATTNYQISAALLGEKPPANVPTGEEDGPADVKSKDQVVKYVKDSFAYAHKAVASLNDKNLLEPINGRGTHLGSANLMVWHSFDHYGQMVVYARMNGIIPPASRQ
jgi:DinB superfamily